MILRENSLLRKTTEEENLHYNSQVTGITRMCWVSQSWAWLKVRSPICWKTRLTYTRLRCWCGRDLHNCMICTCHFVVMTTISGAGLLELHAEKSFTIHNVSCWVALHVMNMKENKWHNPRRRLRLNSCQSYLTRSWSLQNKGIFGAERIWRRSGTTWTSENSYVPQRVGRCGTHVVILDGVRIWPLHSSICSKYINVRTHDTKLLNPKSMSLIRN